MVGAIMLIVVAGRSGTTRIQKTRGTAVRIRGVIIQNSVVIGVREDVGVEVVCLT